MNKEKSLNQKRKDFKEIQKKKQTIENRIKYLAAEQNKYQK